MVGDFSTVGSVLKGRIVDEPYNTTLKAVFIIEISEKIIRSFFPHVDPFLIQVVSYTHGKLIIQVSHNTIAHELQMKESQIRLRLPAEFCISGFRYIIKG